jgi:long-subunit fatty acid transport protein
MTVSASVVVAAAITPATSVFENKAALERFKQNQLDFGANASAIIAKTGAAKNASFVDGVAIFVRPTAGAMAEASPGGQRVTGVPK